MPDNLNKFPNCSKALSKATNILGDNWNLLIIKQLLSGKKRFNELMETVEGICKSVLSDRLKKLEETEILVREISPSYPVKIEYKLSDKGEKLSGIIKQIETFAKGNL